MKKNEIMYTGPLTGTVGEAQEKGKAHNNEEFAEEFDPIQTMWAVNPVDEAEIDGTVGYKES